MTNIILRLSGIDYIIRAVRAWGCRREEMRNLRDLMNVRSLSAARAINRCGFTAEFASKMCAKVGRIGIDIK